MRSDLVSGQPERVLLVDDNPTNLQVLFQTLNGQSYKLLVAKGGEQALEIAAKARPDLILLDIMMPGIDGFETCRRLKRNPETADVAVIFLSALDDTNDKVKGFEAGAVDYISKPFEAREVIVRVETHLKLRRLERRLSRQNRELAAINQRMKMDLEAAAKVQKSLLPEALPDNDDIRFAWRYRPSDELAGDSLNIFALDDRHIGLYVVDVSGHGVSASLLAVTISRNLRVGGELALLTSPAQAGGGLAINSPAEVASRLNLLYPMQGTARLYFTLLYGVFDRHTRAFRFVSAGNPGPVVVRANGGIEVFDTPAVPIGLLPDSQYQDTVIELHPGDRLYLHSDGLNEERNAAGEEFGRERMSSVLAGCRNTSLEASLDTLLEKVIDWRGHEHRQLRDDVAVVASELSG